MNNEWKNEEQRIKHDAVILRERSKTLREQSIILCAEIDAFADKYPDDILNKLPWDEKESVIGMAADLEKRWLENRRFLTILDAEFRCLIRRTNELYGEEIIQEPEPLSKNLPENLQDDTDTNNKDEWSKPEDWWKSE